MEKVWYWVDAFFYSIIPSILLSILNTLIILGIRRATVIHRALTEGKYLYTHHHHHPSPHHLITIIIISSLSPTLAKH